MMSKSEKQKMLDGELYDAGDPEIQSDQAAAREWLVRFNAASGVDPSQRRMLLAERLAQVGNGSTVRPPFHCDYGTNIRLGAGVFLNFGCVILDVASVTIGDGTQIGPERANPDCRSSEGLTPARLGLGVRPSHSHRAQRLDRGWGDPPARRSSGGRCSGRRG
jgi:acetyltransferase-like isoleucine patch superfamily enzyme